MTTEFILANLIVCLAGFVQASAGIGFGMIAVPLLVLINPDFAPGPALFVMMFLALAMIVRGARDIDYHGLPVLLPGLMVGTIAGTFLLGILNQSSFEIVFGGIVLSALAFGQLGLAPRQTPATNGTGGFLAGLMGTISGIHGPALAVIYQRANHATARATMALVFLIGGALSLVSLNTQDLFGRPGLIVGLMLLPGLSAGYLLSLAGRNLISEKFARLLMLGFAAVSSAILIGKNLV